MSQIIETKPPGHDTPIGEKFRDEARPDVVLEVVAREGCRGCFYDDGGVCGGCDVSGHCGNNLRTDDTCVLFQEVPQPRPEPSDYPTREEIIEKIRELWPEKSPMFSRVRLGQREAYEELLAFIEPPDMTFREAAGRVLSGGGQAARRGRQETELRKGVPDGCLFTRNLVESDIAETDWYIVKEKP